MSTPAAKSMAPGAPMPPRRNAAGAALTTTVSGAAADMTKNTMSQTPSLPTARLPVGVGSTSGVDVVMDPP